LKGGIVTRLPKKKMSIKMQEDVALLIKTYFEKSLKYNSNYIDSKLCISYHVYSGKMVHYPSAYIRRLENLTGAAKMVTALWSAY